MDSVRKTGISQQTQGKEIKHGEYSTYKSEFEKVLKKLEKSDMANSPSFFSYKLEGLNKLLEIAQKEGLKEEAEILKNSIEETKKEEAEKIQVKELPSHDFYYGLRLNSKEIKNTNALSKEVFINDNQIENAVKKLKKADFSDDTAAKIISLAAARNQGENQASLFDNKIDLAVSLKNVLRHTRGNEKKETENPINKHNTTIVEQEDNIIVIKNQKVQKIYSKNDKKPSLQSLSELYNNILDEEENIFITQFLEKYNTNDIETSNNYIRLITQLRNYGITNSKLPEILDFCMDKDLQINRMNLDLISNLKQKGNVRDEDLTLLLQNIEKDENGNYSQEDAQTVCALSNYLLDGESIVKILPYVRNNEQVKEFTYNMANTFRQKYYVPEVLKVVYPDEYIIDTNALDTVNVLTDNIYCKKDNLISEKEFTELIKQIMYLAKNPEERVVNDNSAGICSIMSHNNHSPEEIMAGLQLCKDNNGYFDDGLSQVLWDLCLQNADFADIEEILSACKDKNGTVNPNLTQTIHTYLNNGEDVNKIKSYLN